MKLIENFLKAGSDYDLRIECTYDKLYKVSLSAVICSIEGGSIFLQREADTFEEAFTNVAIDCCRLNLNDGGTLNDGPLFPKLHIFMQNSQLKTAAYKEAKQKIYDADNDDLRDVKQYVYLVTNKKITDPQLLTCFAHYSVRPNIVYQNADSAIKKPLNYYASRASAMLVDVQSSVCLLYVAKVINCARNVIVNIDDKTLADYDYEKFFDTVDINFYRDFAAAAKYATWCTINTRSS